MAQPFPKTADSNMVGLIPATTADMPVTENTYPDEKGVHNFGATQASSLAGTDDEPFSKDAQYGVRAVEAITSVWTRNQLYMAYAFIWLIYFVDSLQQSMSGAFTPYVTSAFQQHSLTAAVLIFSNLIGGLTKLPLAKILDIWGRAEGFLLMMIFMTVGLIMMAACQNVETYAAAQVFYWIGYNGLHYSMSVFIADTSQLKNRALAFAFISSPYIITTWIGSIVASSFLKTVGLEGFRWGFGTFTIVTPVMCLPLYFLFFLNQRKAKKQGLLPARESYGTAFQTIKHYAIEFDLLGMLLIIGGLSLFLLPFSIYSYQGATLAEQWSSPIIICMIVFGIVLLIAFAIWEKFFAPVTFIPFHFLADRTILGSCILAAILFFSFYIWVGYFNSFLQVVNGLSIIEAGYVGNIYSIGSCFSSIFVALAIRWTGRFKWIALYVGLPLEFLGTGLMIYFRQPHQNIGYIIMCQIFIAFSGGCLVIGEEMAAMASVSHQYVAVILALQGAFASIGGAIGGTVATAIWTGVFPEKVLEYLPEENKGDYLTIYASLVTQLSFEKGTPAREAIEQAYGDAQRTMLIAATSVLVLAVGCVVVWKDIRVKDFKQVKGHVF